MTPIVGVKAYGYEWSTVHGLDMAAAARRMRSHGVDWVLAQNLIDPLPGSAVDQRPPSGAYDDAQWVARLRDAGMRVYQSTSCFFAPDEFAAHRDLRPVDHLGRVFEPFSWYVGICPTDPGYLQRKADRLATALAATAPDGCSSRSSGSRRSGRCGCPTRPGSPVLGATTSPSTASASAAWRSSALRPASTSVTAIPRRARA